MNSLHSTNLEGILPLVNRGKVRDIYEVNEELLLFVTTDRVSAYDVIMENGIPSKGKILTRLSEFWFDFLSDKVENQMVFKHNDDEALFSKLPEQLKEDKYRTQLSGRSLLVKKLKLVPLEVIVRGFITGSGWKEYKKLKTIHGMEVKGPELQESEELPEPLFTPSTKAEIGDHDMNISYRQACDIVGENLCKQLSEKAIELYSTAKEYAKTKGIIIADTKFEFGLNSSGNLVLVDEVLTPDSSRFWRSDDYKVGQLQNSYDKQYLRDWLTSTGLAGKEGVSIELDVLAKTKEKYIEAYESITGSKWQN